MLANYLADTGQSVFGFFNSIDLDQSGEIDTYEFQTALKNADIADLPPWEMEPLMESEPTSMAVAVSGILEAKPPTSTQRTPGSKPPCSS